MGKRGRLLAGNDPAERKRARTVLGPLADLRIMACVKKRYYHAVQVFVLWCLLVVGFIPESLEQLDDIYFEYMGSCWLEGEPRSLVADGLSGLCHFLKRRRILSGSWKLLSVWEKWEVLHRTPPLPVEAILAIISLAIEYNDFEFAAVVAIAFHCMLRTAEALQVCMNHVTGSGSRRNL